MTEPTVGGWTIGRIVIAIIACAAIIAIMYVAMNAFGIVIPSIVITILWIVFVAVLAIGAVKLILSMW